MNLFPPTAFLSCPHSCAAVLVTPCYRPSRSELRSLSLSSAHLVGTHEEMCMAGCTEPSPFPKELTVGWEVTDAQGIVRFHGMWGFVL